MDLGIVVIDKNIELSGQGIPLKDLSDMWKIVLSQNILLFTND